MFTPEAENVVLGTIAPNPTHGNKKVGKHSIRVALLLDTSNSMDGLIEQAKSQLWSILNELSRTMKNGADPNLEIALYEYGNPLKGHNQINQLTPFTRDMDLISQQLFALTTNGGDEYCGQIIQTSLDELDWGSNAGDFKVIYIAGNEAFTQGPVNYVLACQQAKEKDIIVNTIFCGDYQEGINTAWLSGANTGGGVYMHIDQNQETAYIETPYDQQINQLSIKLNSTYIPYGKTGSEKKENQSLQDVNANSYSLSNAADRAGFKCSTKYKAEDWDLCDAYIKDKKVLNNTSDLPEDMQNISIEEMEARIHQAINERETIQSEMQELDRKRREYKTEKAKENISAGLQDSMLKSIREQAKKKGFEIGC